MFAWVLLKRATFCGNNCENVGIILRIIGEFKNFPERIIGEFKSIIDLSLVITLWQSKLQKGNKVQLKEQMKF